MTVVKATEPVVKATSKNKEVKMIRVLIDGEKSVIKSSDIDSKKHLHISGREFTSKEVTAIKG